MKHYSSSLCRCPGTLGSRIAGSLLLAFVLPFTSLAEDYLSEEAFFEEEVQGTIEVYDPFEPVNRFTFQINDLVLLNLVQPLANGYQAITPDPVEKSASNFMRNLKYPVRLAGNILQGRVRGALVETGRFAVNSTVGIAGLFTPADGIDGLEPIPKEGIGQALGAWGIGEGPYLVLPLLGPSNFRDFGGLIADRAVNPLDEPFSVADDWDWEWSAALAGTEFIVRSPSLIERYLQMKGSAIDPYSSLKNGYTQFRRAAIEE
ncbi:MAG: VacJ family lipoprotein [Opitutales bacterium]